MATRLWHRRADAGLDEVHQGAESEINIGLASLTICIGQGRYKEAARHARSLARALNRMLVAKPAEAEG